MSVAYPKTRFQDNMIPLKGGLFGPQLAGWTPRSAVRERMGCRLYADQMIPVEAGIALAADVYTPKKPGRYPAIIAYSAYCTQLQSTGAPTGTNETGSPPVFTNRGYAHVIVARRGMGRSQGESTAYFNDQDVEDHAKVIAWAAVQPLAISRRTMWLQLLATAILSSADRSPVASLTASSLAQKCTKKRRGCS